MRVPFVESWFNGKAPGHPSSPAPLFCFLCFFGVSLSSTNRTRQKKATCFLGSSFQPSPKDTSPCLPTSPCPRVKRMRRPLRSLPGCFVQCQGRVLGVRPGNPCHVDQGTIPGIESDSILFNHRSFQQTSCFLRVVVERRLIRAP